MRLLMTPPAVRTCTHIDIVCQSGAIAKHLCLRINKPVACWDGCSTSRSGITGLVVMVGLGGGGAVKAHSTQQLARHALWRVGNVSNSSNHKQAPSPSYAP